MYDEQIQEYRMRIAELENEIEQMKGRMEQCEEALSDIEKKQSAYEESCYMQQQRARELCGNYSRVRYTKQFGNCISQIMNGANHRKLQECFETEREIVHGQYGRMDNNIRDMYRQIDELEYQIEEAQRQCEIESMQLY